MSLKKILIFFFLKALVLNYSNVLFAEVKIVKKAEFGSEAQKEYLFFELRNVKLDKQGNVFVLDVGTCSIKKFNNSFELQKEAGKKGQGPGEFDTPASMDIDDSGSVYIYDSGKRSILVFDNDLNFKKNITLEKPELFYRIFLTVDRNLILAKNAMLQGENYFYEFSSEGRYLKSFFGVFQKLAPRMKGMEELRNYSKLILYFLSCCNINPKRDQIAFTHLVPEDPMKIYLIDIKTGTYKTLKYKIPGYNAQEYFEYTKQGDYKQRSKFPHLYNIFMTRENFIITQRRIDILKDNSQQTKFIVDIFSPDGKLLKEGIAFDKILDIDADNNIYCEKEDNGITKLIIYSLKI